MLEANQHNISRRRMVLTFFFGLLCMVTLAYWLWAISGFDGAGEKPGTEVQGIAGLTSDQENATGASSNEILSGAQTSRQRTALAYPSRYGALPDSLQGTVMQTALAVDEHGQLRISNDIQQVFDYFLSAINDEEIDVIVGRIHEYLEYYLQAPALDEAKQILLSYIDLKQALFEYELAQSEAVKMMAIRLQQGEKPESGQHLTMLREQLDARNRLRAEWLNADVHQAFYAEQEQYDDYTLQRLEIQSNTALTDHQKARQLEILDHQAPADIIASRKEAMIIDEFRARRDEIKQTGGNEEELRALQVEMFGEAAGERFELLAQQRKDWQQRLQDYHQKREDILNAGGISEAQQRAQVEQLRSQSFSPTEQLRVRIMERQRQG